MTATPEYQIRTTSLLSMPANMVETNATSHKQIKQHKQLK
jgi:hypothetical protein